MYIICNSTYFYLFCSAITVFLIITFYFFIFIDISLCAFCDKLGPSIAIYYMRIINIFVAFFLLFFKCVLLRIASCWSMFFLACLSFFLMLFFFYSCSLHVLMPAEDRKEIAVSGKLISMAPPEAGCEWWHCDGTGSVGG